MYIYTYTYVSLYLCSPVYTYDPWNIFPFLISISRPYSTHTYTCIYKNKYTHTHQEIASTTYTFCFDQIKPSQEISFKVLSSCCFIFAKFQIWVFLWYLCMQMGFVYLWFSDTGFLLEFCFLGLRHWLRWTEYICMCLVNCLVEIAREGRSFWKV